MAKAIHKLQLVVISDNYQLQVDILSFTWQLLVVSGTCQLNGNGQLSVSIANYNCL